MYISFHVHMSILLISSFHTVNYMLVIIISIGIIIELDIAKFLWDYSTYKKNVDSYSCRKFSNMVGGINLAWNFILWVVNWAYVATLFNWHGFMGINNRWSIINHFIFCWSFLMVFICLNLMNRTKRQIVKFIKLKI